MLYTYYNFFGGIFNFQQQIIFQEYFLYSKELSVLDPQPKNLFKFGIYYLSVSFLSNRVPYTKFHRIILWVRYVKSLIKLIENKITLVIA